MTTGIEPQPSTSRRDHPGPGCTGRLPAAPRRGLPGKDLEDMRKVGRA